MYARTTRWDGVPEDKRESGIELFRDSLSQLANAGGSRGAMLLVDRSTGNSLAISLWESEEAMRASEETADRVRRAAGQEFAAEPTIERFEVAVTDLPS